jgi:hypothetical protein
MGGNSGGFYFFQSLSSGEVSIHIKVWKDSVQGPDSWYWCRMVKHCSKDGEVLFKFFSQT